MFFFVFIRSRRLEEFSSCFFFKGGGGYPVCGLLHLRLKVMYQVEKRSILSNSWAGFFYKFHPERKGKKKNYWPALATVQNRYAEEHSGKAVVCARESGTLLADSFGRPASKLVVLLQQADAVVKVVWLP